MRFSSRGFYLLEDLVATLVMGFSLVAATFSLAAFDLLVSFSEGTALFWAFPPLSLAVGALLVLIGRELLAETLSSVDVAS